MIITRLQGGLANQIFQWAYGKYLSEKYNTPLYLDINSYNFQAVGDTIRNFALSKFPNLKYRIIPSNNINDFLVEKEKTKLKVIKDKFEFDLFEYEDYTNYYLDGFWQSDIFFKDIENIIKKELNPSDETKEKLNKIPFIDKNNISLHIRRTDYATSKGYHPVQDIDYYMESIEKIGKYDYLFIFSDDIKWCKDNFKFNNMIFIEGFDDVEDIWIMSMCKNNIIANSSFSWWGAWLNENPNKKVVAPKKWFGEIANLRDDKIVPDNWIRI